MLQTKVSEMEAVDNLKDLNGNKFKKKDDGRSELLFMRLSSLAKTPTKAFPGSAGYDLYSAEQKWVEPKEKTLVNTDLSIQLPSGTYGRIAPRSGMALFDHIGIGGGVVDREFTGNVGVILFNHSSQPKLIRYGDKIAQLICEKIADPIVVEVKEMPMTLRGSQGFGSTSRTPQLWDA